MQTVQMRRTQAERTSQVMSAVSDGSASSAPHTENRRPLSSAEERALKKKQEAEERRAAREKERLEKLIEECENAITANEAEMCREENLTNHQYLTELSEKMRSQAQNSG